MVDQCGEVFPLRMVKQLRLIRQSLMNITEAMNGIVSAINSEFFDTVLEQSIMAQPS